jgi:acetylornithine deacetylase
VEVVEVVEAVEGGGMAGDRRALMVNSEFVKRTLQELVRINSINPALGPGTNEAEIAGDVARRLEALGMAVMLREPEPGRVSVIGRLPGTQGGDGKSLMLYAHLDTVGVEGMADPFSGEIRDGRLYGRGAYDMKGGLAACIGAVRTLRDAGIALAGDLLIVGVADEEVASIGMADLLERFTADAAIVTESTELDVCIAHKGFSWIAVETVGRAAHGSRFNEGIDANMRMGRFLGELDRLEQRLRASSSHPLVGPPSLHAAQVKGGIGPSTYSPHCRLDIERRTVPGETEAGVTAELRAIADRLGAVDPTFRATVAPTLTRAPFEISIDRPVVQAVLAAATEVLGRAPRIIGEPYWMDAALLAGRGIETAVIGPAGGGAHAAEEWVEVGSVVALSEILAHAAVRLCAPRSLDVTPGGEAYLGSC